MRRFAHHRRKRFWIQAAPRSGRRDTGNGLGRDGKPPLVSPRVERTDPDGVDFGWVMQVTFVLGIVLGAPLVAGLSLLRSLPTWEARVLFAVRVGALVWLVVAASAYTYARWYRVDGVDGVEEAEGPTEP